MHICVSDQYAKINDEIDDEVTTYEWIADPTIPDGMTTPYLEVDFPDKLTDGEDDIAAGNMHGGTYYIYVCVGESKAILDRATFYIVGVATASINVNNGYVGDEVIVTGSGFAPDEALIVEFANRDISGTVGNPYTEEDGTFELIFDIPESIIGEQDIVITGEDSGAEFELPFTVKPKLVVTPTSDRLVPKLQLTHRFDYRNGIILIF